jgi:hypothetical protein
MRQFAEIARDGKEVQRDEFMCSRAFLRIPENIQTDHGESKRFCLPQVQ